MKLNSTLANNPQVEFVIDEIKKQSKVRANDVICAYNLFCDNNPHLDEQALKRLNRVFIMCKYMEPDADDVISMMLFPDNLNKKASMRIFMKYFAEERYEGYYKQMANACDNAVQSNPKNKGWTKEDCIGYYIMIRVCDKMFKRMMKRINNNRTPNAIVISDAYYMAKAAHEWDVTKSGEPYIVHSIRIAGILEEIGAESNVIAAALLHDVVGKTEYTLEDITKACNGKIAQYVAAVTSVHKECMKSHSSAEIQFDKSPFDEKSFQELISHLSSNNDMIFALYIKAAERIHNLELIDEMSSFGVNDENDENQLDYLPLFKAFKLNWFVQRIEDLMWRAADIERYTQMQDKYDDMILYNRVFIDEFKTILDKNVEWEINNFAKLLGGSGYYVKNYERLLTPYEVYNHIKNAGGTVGNLLKRIDKRFVHVCDIDIVADPKGIESDLDIFVSGFVKMFEKKIAMTGRTIVDFNKTEKTYVFYVEDHYGNVFRCRLVLREEYEIQKKGIYVKDVTEALEEESNGKSEKIKVKLRNDNTLSLPKGATVIDVAFAIHEEVGHTVKGAIINGKNATIYRTLQDGDKIIVEADTCREDGVTKKEVHIPHVRISWLNWVVTKRAKKKIIEYLSAKYYEDEGDDPKNESRAETPVVETAANKILEELWPTKQLSV